MADEQIGTEETESVDTSPAMTAEEAWADRGWYGSLGALRMDGGRLRREGYR